MDLGNLTEACIARPETCSEAGAAVAFWTRVEHNAYVGRGIVLSGGSMTTRFGIYYIYQEL